VLGRRRTQSERDAATVEMVFAAVTGALLAAAGFIAVISPVLAGAVHGAGRKGCFTGAVVLAAALFCGRVAITLRRFERLGRLRGADPHGPAAAPPGQTPSDPSITADPVHASGSAASSRRGDGPSPDQPSQPGRTSPDS